MKTLPISSNIMNSGIRIKRASEDGYNIAVRAAQIYKHNDFHKYLNVTRSVSDKVISGTTVDELPYLGGAIGLFIPALFMSPLLMALGFLAKYATKGAGTLYNRQCEARINPDFTSKDYNV